MFSFTENPISFVTSKNPMYQPTVDSPVTVPWTMKHTITTRPSSSPGAGAFPGDIFLLRRRERGAITLLPSVTSQVSQLFTTRLLLLWRGENKRPPVFSAFAWNTARFSLRLLLFDTRSCTRLISRPRTVYTWSEIHRVTQINSLPRVYCSFSCNNAINIPAISSILFIISGKYLSS